MSLFRALHTSATGLRVSQAALSTISHNIANADTEGYSRQRVEAGVNLPLKTAYRASYLGQGVRVDSIGRADDRFAELQVTRDRTLNGFYDSRDHTLAAVERLYTEGTEPTLGGALDAFFNSARALSQDAGDLAARRQLLREADGVARAFRTMDRDLREIQRGIDDDMQEKLDRVNALAEVIGEMNARIVSGEIGTRQANDFRDQRDQAIRDLSDLVDVNVLPQENGAFNVEIAGQWALVQEDISARLEATPNGANQGLVDVELVDVNGGRHNITTDLDEGEIGGALDVRDRILGGDLAALDQLAFEFSNAVNAQHALGFGLDGVGGRALFVPLAGPQFAAANLAVDPVVAQNPDQVAAAANPALLPGDNVNALALADLQNQRQAGLNNVTFNRRHAEILHGVGFEMADNRRRLDVQRVKSDQSEALRESVEGVSIDDEMIDLTKYQKHFQANTRVISTVDQLIDQVLSLVQ